MNFLLKLDQVVGLIKMGLSSGKAILDAFRAGRVAITDDTGLPATDEDVLTAISAAQNAALAAGDAAAGRIDGRHGG